MGAKATKIDGTYLPDTPTLNRLRMANAANAAPIELSITPCRDNNTALLDPRSPNGCRTPLNLPQLATETFQMPVPAPATAAASENTFAQLRKRLLKGFALNDPRSPQLNRTPLILDEAIDRTLNMDDTFSDLFVETRAPQATAPVETIVATSDPADVSHSSSVEIVSLAYEEEETMPCDMILPRTPPVQSIDPRSPSIGVERTPIIFCDDDEAEERETQMLEDILETLTLNLSNESSLASFVSASADLSQDELQLQSQPQAQTVNPQAQSQTRPANKHLERVRLGNKRRVPPRKPARASKSQIYVDATDPLSSTPKSTPNSAQRTQRTPLGSVNKNRFHLRSRSVEKDLLKPQLQLKLKSFDDQLNPSERLNVSSLRLLMAGENHFEN